MLTTEQRLTKLERKLSFYQSATGILLLCSAFIFITAFNDSDVNNVVKAKEFQVVGSDGKTYMVMGSNSSGGDLKLYSTEGTNTVHLLQSTAGNGVVALENKRGNLSCRVGDYASGAGCIEAYNESGIAVAEFGSSDRGTGFIGTKDENGKDLVKITYTNGNYAGWIGIYNASHQNIVRICAGDDGHGSVAAYNGSGTKISFIGSDKDGNGCLNIYDRYGNGLNGVWPK